MEKGISMADTTKVLTTKEEKEAFLRKLPKLKHGFVYECPYCKTKIKLPYACAGKEITCTCGFTSTVRDLTSDEIMKYHFLENKDLLLFIIMGFAVSIIALLYFM